jgi:hypothetical protein
MSEHNLKSLGRISTNGMAIDLMQSSESNSFVFLSISTYTERGSQSLLLRLEEPEVGKLADIVNRALYEIFPKQF